MTDPIVFVLGTNLVTILASIALILLIISCVVQIKNQLKQREAIKKFESEWDEFKEEYLKGGEQ